MIFQIPQNFDIIDRIYNCLHCLHYYLLQYSDDNHLILNLLIRLQRELNLTYLFISHDMGVIQHMCDEVAVLYLGKIVEQADRNSLFNHPLHPYTWSLLSAVPSIYSDAESLKQRVNLQGDPPSAINPPVGCRFAQRCPFADVGHHCYSNMPLLRNITGGHKVACHRVSDDGVAPQDVRPT